MTDTQFSPPAPARQGQVWTAEEDRRLYDSFLAGRPISSIASVHERSTGGILSRLRRLGLVTQDGEVVEPPPPFAVPERRRSGGIPGSGAVGNKQRMHLAFAATAADGWRIEIKSNRPLNKPMIERLALMLEGGVIDPGGETR